MRLTVSGHNARGGDRMSHEDREDAEVVASAGECTGLVPALRDGDDACRALYNVPRARRPKRRTE